MSIRRTAARLCAVPVAAATLTLAAVAPASAHVTGTPSDAAAGAFTILTMSVPHGCDGSPTTKIEIQIPESVLSVTPTRNPLYDVRTTIEQLDEPVTDAHGNEVTERTAHGRLHGQHPAARRPARHLRAVVPGPRRGGRDARVPDDPDLRAG